MKKCLAILLTALLALSAVSALAEVTLVPYSEVRDASIISGSNMLKIDTGSGYALADLDGTELTQAVYDFSMNGYYGWITAARRSGSSLVKGVLSPEGEEVVPFRYGEVSILNTCWALAYKLKLATADNYDYYSFGIGTSDTYYLIDTVDVYYLPEARLAATFPRANFRDCDAFGAYINIENRATGVVTTYDSDFNVLGTVMFSIDMDLIPHYTTYSERGKQGLLDPDGNVVLPAGYKYVDADIHDGYYRISTGDLYGLADLNGNVVVPAEYEAIKASYWAHGSDYTGPYVVNGYATVVKDGKLGYYSIAEGRESCEPRYSEDTLNNYGMSGIIGKTLVAADGVETQLEGYEDVYPLGSTGGLLYRVKDADNYFGAMDWHGNLILPMDYYSVEISGDGKYLLVQKNYDDPVQVLEVIGPNETAANEMPADETAAVDGGEDAKPSATGDGESVSAAAALLDNAILLLNTDPATNGPAAITLLENAVPQMGSNEDALSLVNSAITLLQADSAGNAAAAITVLEKARSML